MEQKQMLLVSDGVRECLMDMDECDSIPAELETIEVTVTYGVYSADKAELEIVGLSGTYIEDDYGYLVKREG